VGTGPDPSDLDEQIETVSAEKRSAVDAQEHERAASLRDRETNCSTRRPLARKNGQPTTPARPPWPSNANSSAARSNGSALCSASTASTPKTAPA
jgi:hypothetical protein